MGSSSSKAAEESVQKLINENPVIVFSKSYCPYCDKTKQLLKSTSVAHKVVELDQVSGGSAMQKYLASYTG